MRACVREWAAGLGQGGREFWPHGGASKSELDVIAMKWWQVNVSDEWASKLFTEAIFKG